MKGDEVGSTLYLPQWTRFKFDRDTRIAQKRVTSNLRNTEVVGS